MTTMNNAHYFSKAHEACYADLPLMPSWLEINNESWVNDACANFRVAPDVRMWIDYAGRGERENSDAARFTVYRTDFFNIEKTTLLETEDWCEAIDFCESLRESCRDAMLKPLAVMLASRQHEGRLLTYTDGEDISGEIEIEKDGRFYVCVGNLDHISRSLESAEMFLFNTWFLSDRMVRLEEADHARALGLLERDASLYESFKSVGFEHWQTGGGCTAYVMQLVNGNHIMVTAGESAAVPTSVCDICTVYMYADDSDDYAVMVGDGMRADEVVKIYANEVWQALRAEI